MNIEQKISAFTQHSLQEYPVSTIRDDKIFHDPLRGTQKLYKHEMALIDTFLIQRLKRIHQTGFACQVYPSATHTRFEHSLGVLHFASRMLESIRKLYPKLCTDHTLYTVRLAALLHDIGTLPFSHCSELFISSLDEIKKLAAKPEFANCKIHEILSFLITNSKPFQEYLLKEVAKKYPVDFSSDMIPLLIIGAPKNPDADKFLADLINGTFDADKLDYLTRDSYYTGLPMSVDTERLLHSLDLPNAEESGQRRLIVDIKGVPCLEQVLFNKIYLYSTVYHHHKIRSIECMLTNMYDLAYEENRTFDERILEVDDCSVFQYLLSRAPTARKDVMSQLITSVKNRRLYMRSVVFAPQSLEEATRVNLQELSKRTETLEGTFEIRDELSKRVGCDPVQIAIDLPPIPYVREVTHELVRVSPGKVLPLKSLYPIDEWLRSYSENKWKGHIFTLEEYREKAYAVAVKFLKSEYDIVLNDFSRDFAKY